MKSMLRSKFSMLFACQINSRRRSQTSTKTDSVKFEGGCSGSGLLFRRSNCICLAIELDLTGGSGAILGMRSRLFGGDLIGNPLGLLRSKEGERLSFVGSGIWSMKVGVQCGLGFATFGRVEHKFVLPLLCRLVSVVSVCMGVSV